ncbi:hypothetical protein OCO_39780 [Mycobacterium intracellulare MOTT-02]|nr:hypothetical protein OCO_39780 [Mycobacterium intracellulare MOTT-02]
MLKRGFHGFFLKPQGALQEVTRGVLDRWTALALAPISSEA